MRITVKTLFLINWGLKVYNCKHSYIYLIEKLVRSIYITSTIDHDDWYSPPGMFPSPATSFQSKFNFLKTTSPSIRRNWSMMNTPHGTAKELRFQMDHFCNGPRTIFNYHIDQTGQHYHTFWRDASPKLKPIPRHVWDGWTAGNGPISEGILLW